MPDVSPILLEINNVEREGMEWGMSFEEVLGDNTRAKINVQDRDNTYEPEAHWPVKVSRREGPIGDWSGIFFQGEIITEPVDLTTGLPFRIWELDCAGPKVQFPQRKIGAFDGKTWIDQFGLGVFVNIDPNAVSLATDRLTVQNWFDKYIRYFGQAFDTDTFVGEYLTDFNAISLEYSDLEQALNQLAALINANLQYWPDPDLRIHWVTIPSWQDLDDLIAGAVSPGSDLSLGFPEGTIYGLEFAPVDASDIRAEEGQIGFSNLKWDFDGSEMPEQVYVRGGTGYVYNAPPIPPADETKTVVKNATPGVAATYHLTFLTSTKIWHTDNTGFVSTSFDTAAAGGPYNVKYVQIPWSPSRNKGGMFWKLLEGPDAGKLVDNDTNYFGYGSIRVVQVIMTPGTPEDPKVGIGGSGWTNEVDQDLNKRQAYLEAPISVTKAMRDSLGGMALYRGATPTLRGSMDVYGIDGFRAGQIIKITDQRMDNRLDGKHFIIQRVSGSLLPGNDLRRYQLDWGDGPTSRWSAQPQTDEDVTFPPPAIQIDIDVRDLAPGPNSSQRVTGQLINAKGDPWGISGKTVNWSFECYNALGVLQTGQGSIDPEVSITDRHGRAYTTLTSGSGTGLVYYVFANVVAE